MEHIKPRAKVLRHAVEHSKGQHRPDTVMLTVAEVCAHLRISKTKLYELFRGGKLASVKIGRRRLIPTSSIVKFVQQLEADADTGK